MKCHNVRIVSRPGLSFTIIFGAQNIKADRNVTRTTSKKLVHERYQDDGLISNDIALLYFDDPITFSE